MCYSGRGGIKMEFRILGLTSTQQNILKLQSQNVDSNEIIKQLDVESYEVKAVSYITDRLLTKRWKKSKEKCFELIRAWNSLNILVLMLCLLPMFESDDQYVRRPARRSSRMVRVRARKKD